MIVHRYHPVSIALYVAMFLGACGDDKRAPAPVAGSAHGSAPVAPHDASDPTLSRGFLPPAPEPPLTPLEADKLARLKRREAGLVDLDAERQARSAPAAGLDIYVDDKRVRSVTVGDTQIALATILGVPAKNARGLIVAADAGARWIAGGEVADYQLRLNKQGLIKLAWSPRKDDEPEDMEMQHGKGDGGGTGGGGGRNRKQRNNGQGRAGGGMREQRSHELRGVKWIEVRTAASPRLPLEP